MRLLKFTLMILLFPMFLFAQKTEIGGFAGIANYQGDLMGPGFSLKNSGIAVGVLGKYHISDRLALRGGVNIARIKGDDNDFDENRRRQFAFQSTLIDVSGVFEFYLFKMKNSNSWDFKKSVRPYVYLGAGFVFSNPDVELPANKKRTEGEEDANKSAFTIPLGAGLQFNLSPATSLSGEVTFRSTAYDDLDGFSESANPLENDWYWMAGLVLTRRLGVVSN